VFADGGDADLDLSYKLGYIGAESRFRIPGISRKVLARALLDQLEGSEWIGKEPAVYQ
jgi:hypothetical protein